jgi:predicted TIM-barrel fold metal-dependent hydrolase
MFKRSLSKIVETGFGNRVMYGSDQMVWPELLEIGIQIIEKADYLTQKQKRDILYNNAARFLQLSEAEIKRHHGN